MSPFLVVVRCTLSPAGVAGRREAGAERRPTGVPQPQPLRPSVRLDSAPILPRHAPDLHQPGFHSQGSSGQLAPLQFPAPIHHNCTRPSRSVRTINFPPHQIQGLVLPVQLIPHPATSHRPVALHHPLLLPAQHFVQLPWHAPMHVGGTGARGLFLEKLRPQPTGRIVHFPVASNQRRSVS